MHIVFVTTEFVTEKVYCGGLSNFTANMARIFRQNGHEVTVLTATTHTDTQLWEGNIRVESIKRNWETSSVAFLPVSWSNSSLFCVAQTIYGSIKVNQKLREIHQRRRIDIIHYCSAGALSLFPPAVPWLIRLSSYENLCQGAYRPEFDPEYRKNKRDASGLMSVLAVRHAPALVSPSRMLAQITEQNLHRKAKVIESPFFSETDYDTSWYQEHLNHKQYILFYGTLGYLKGAHIIAAIVHELLGRHPELTLIMIGNSRTILDETGQEVPASRLIARNAGPYQDRVLYHGSMEKARLMPVIQNARLVLLPSRIDNLPNACIESMALGRIVIGTNGASFEQLIRHGKNGYLGKRDCPESYLACIEQALALTDAEQRSMGQLAKRRCLQMSPQLIYRKYLRFYEEVITFYNA